MGGPRVQKRMTFTATDKALWGEQLYHERARAAFPILVRQAKAEQTIIYQDLAREISMPNPRNLDYPLGAIGEAILELSKEWDEKIPPIGVLVINRKKRIPGRRFSWTIANREVFERSSKRQQKQMIKEMLLDVFAYDRWDDALVRFGLQPVDDVAPSSSIEMESHYSTQGESEEHEDLKAFVSINPEVVDLGKRFGPVTVEYDFLSADTLDVLFKGKKEWVGVEVKSRRSSVADITRGIYQCVKYEALIEAQQKVEQFQPNARMVLLLEDPFPTELLALKHTLGIEVIDEVQVE